MYSDTLGIQDRLEEILESIELIQEWSDGMTELLQKYSHPNS